MLHSFEAVGRIGVHCLTETHFFAGDTPGVLNAALCASTRAMGSSGRSAAGRFMAADGRCKRCAPSVCQQLLTSKLRQGPWRVGATSHHGNPSSPQTPPAATLPAPLSLFTSPEPQHPQVSSAKPIPLWGFPCSQVPEPESVYTARSLPLVTGRSWHSPLSRECVALRAPSMTPSMGERLKKTLPILRPSAAPTHLLRTSPSANKNMNGKIHQHPAPQPQNPVPPLHSSLNMPPPNRPDAAFGKDSLPKGLSLQDSLPKDSLPGLSSQGSIIRTLFPRVYHY